MGGVGVGRGWGTHRKFPFRANPTSDGLLATPPSPINAVSRDCQNFFQFVVARMAGESTLSRPVARRVPVAMARDGLKLVVTLLAEVVVGTAQAVMPRPGKILRAAELRVGGGGKRARRSRERREGRGGEWRVGNECVCLCVCVSVCAGGGAACNFLSPQIPNIFFRFSRRTRCALFLRAGYGS